MDLLTSNELAAVAARRDDVPAVSMFMPTHRFGSSDTAADAIRWKNLLKGTNDALIARGTSRVDTEALLAPATALLDDAMSWQHMSDGLAVFLQPGWQSIYRVPFAVPEIATIGDRLTISPLLRATSRGDHFLILTVSQRRVRLLEATRDTIERVELREVPTSLRDVVEAHDPRSDTMARSLAGGSSGPAVFYGHGAADDEFKTDESIKFFRQVATGLHEYLADQDLPMVLFGLEAPTALFRDVFSYAHLTKDSVRQNPDQLDAEALHKAAWPVVADHIATAKQGLIDRFHALNGTGQASADAARVEEAAEHGRVETLFVAVEPWGWQSEMTQTPAIVDLDQAGTPATGFVRLERTAVGTLSSRGDVYTVADASVPGGGQVAATFRY
ncbi:MAG: hypothetical protein ABI239_05460 [Aquihabitans sp.]